MPLHTLHGSHAALNSTPAVTLGIGAALLLAGRKLFWFFVAAVGFFAATLLASEYLANASRDAVLIGSLIAGLVGAVLAIYLKKLAVGFAGAVTGAFLVDQVLRSLPEYPELGWLILIAAAVVGALLMAVLFDWALIVLTALAGAHLIGEWLPLTRGWLAAAYAALVVIGIAVQSRRRRPAVA